MIRKRAFTLIELLVVVTIIAVLIAILLPALAKAKAETKKLTCLSRLHQLGVATAMYLKETQGFYPVLKSETESIHRALDPYIPFSLSPYKTWTAGLSSQYYDPSPNWVCPVTVDIGEEGKPFGRPYAPNAGFAFGKLGRLPGELDPYYRMWGGWGRIRETDIGNPSHVVWMTEVGGNQWDGPNYNNWHWRQFVFGQFWGMSTWPYVEFYHDNNTKAGTLLADGHAAMLTVGDLADITRWIIHE